MSIAKKALMPLVIASSNVHKIREIKEILKEILPLELLSLRDFSRYKSAEETGSSFQENATEKALHAAKSLRHWALADDSGLVIPALCGEPGIYSARYAGKDASDADNRNKLLFKMQTLMDAERDGYFECCLALVSPDGSSKKISCATVEGTILHQEKGSSGFGYDSLFVKHGYHKTFAELESHIKNKISHRRKALDKLLPSLEELFF